MEYKSYPMHEKMHMKKYFLIKDRFIVAYPKDIRLLDADSDSNYEYIELSKGDIITIKPFRYMVDTTLYCYLVCFYNNSNIRVDCGFETVLSLDFLLINEKIFEEVTESFIRDFKINDILGIK